MEEKNLYTSEEVAQIAEAYRKIYSNGMPTNEDLNGYGNLVPQSIQNKIGQLRDLEWEYWNVNTNKERKEEIKKSDLFKKFEEFFEVFGD